MITLHHCPQTRSMRTLWLLHELDVPFETKVYPFDQSLKSDAFLAMSPVGRVPALEIDGTAMCETGAIAEYLCERFPEAGLGRLPGHEERRDWLVWVHFSETISQHVAALTQQHVMLFEDHMRSPTVMKIEAARLRKCFEALSKHLEGQEMLLPSGFSAADICVGQAVYMGAHFTPIEPHAALSRWFQTITARPAFQVSLPAEGERPFYKQAFYPAWTHVPEAPA